MAITPKVLQLAEPPFPPGWVHWPSNLPRCADSWKEAPIDPRVRSDMEIGRPKTRRRYTGIMRKISVSFVLGNPDGGANEAFIALRDFYEQPGNGSGTGATPHIGGTNGGYIFFKFTSPADGVDHYYRFLTPPTMSSTGPLTFAATMDWEEL